MENPGNRTYAEHGESVFTTITRLTREHDAVNLGQGFPNLYPPEELVEAFPNEPDRVMDHQYAPSPGRSELRERLADLYDRLHGFRPDPGTEITITCGATGGLNAALMGLLNPGDRVVVPEPAYDLYIPVAKRAGATVETVALEEPGFGLPIDRLLEKLDETVDLLILNNPHNPTGRVFSTNRLQQIIDRCGENEIIILADEVYEHLVLDREHTPFWSLEGGRERTLFTGSAGKAFNATGWKVGWAIGPEPLTRALRRAHQFTTYATPTPLQIALTRYLSQPSVIDWWEASFRPNYRRRRDRLLQALEASPFDPVPAEGTYFQLARVPEDWRPELQSDFEVVRHLIKKQGLATIPLEPFYRDSSPRDRYLRFAFCKTDRVLDRAAKRLRSIGDGSSG